MEQQLADPMGDPFKKRLLTKILNIVKVRNFVK